MAQEKNSMLDTYYLDKKDTQTIDRQTYVKLKLKVDVGTSYRKDDVCALISNNMSGNISLFNASFFPDKHNRTKIPIIKGGRGARLEIRDSSFVGETQIDLKAGSSLKFDQVNVRGNVAFESTFADGAEIRNSYIDGDNIKIVDSDIAGYDIQASNLVMRQQSLVGDLVDRNIIEGKDITLVAQDEDINILEKTNICGDNIEIKGPSSIVNATILDGTLIDNSEVVCESGELTINNASIIEGSKVACFGDETIIEDSSIKNSDITIGKNQEKAKLKDNQKQFKIAKSVVSECMGDMPQFVEQSIMERCLNACQYKRITNCEVVDEEYEKPMFSGILKKFGMEKLFYTDEAYEKYISKDVFEDLDKYRNATKNKDLKINENDEEMVF